jgi:hypothetical protein
VSRYAFRAGAAAAGGFFTRPFTEPLPVQAASFLMPVGGYGSARVDNFRFHEIVSFKAGYTQVNGTEQVCDGHVVRETLASAVVEGLNVLDVVTADRVVARLGSGTRGGGKPSDELAALPFGSYFENLRIAGHLIGPVCHPHLLDERFATKSSIAGSDAAPLFDPDAEDEGSPIEPSQHGTLRFSLFRPLSERIAGVSIHPGCRIRIPGFGDIYLGEFVVSAGHRQLTMIRVCLRCPGEGRLAFASVEGNGSDY